MANCIVLASAVIIMVVLTDSSSKAVSVSSEFRKFCLLFALPGKDDGPYIEDFKVKLSAHLEDIGKNIFNGKINLKKKEEIKKQCLRKTEFTPECAYFRIAKIGHNLIDDLMRLEKIIDPSWTYSGEMYTVLLTPWYLDRVFLDLDCGIVGSNQPHPIAQWIYVARWSNLLHSKQEFCTWSKPLQRSVAKNVRREVKTICDDRSTESVCQLQSIFDLVDSVEQICHLSSSLNWQTDLPIFKYYKYAVNINFHSMKHRMPTDISSLYDDTLTDTYITEAYLAIFNKLHDDFKSNDLSFARKILKVLPKTMYLPCDYTAPFPSLRWLVCISAKVFYELTVYIDTYEIGTKNIRKILNTNVNMREYIKNLRSSEIKKIAEQNAHIFQISANKINDKIENKFKQVGKYFSNVANFTKTKLYADVDYIRSRVNMYQNRFKKNIKDLRKRMFLLKKILISSASVDFVEEGIKLGIQLAMAGNPWKWAVGSGNADDQFDTIQQLAEKGRVMFESRQVHTNFKNLVSHSLTLAKKLNKNQRMIKNIKFIMDKASDIAMGSGEGFEAYQSSFLSDYTNYSPQVTKGDLAKLDSYWSLFLDDVCDDIDSTSGVGANVIRQALNAKKLCREIKIAASQLVATQTDIYDLQFELVETTANIMRSLTQIHSANLLKKGSSEARNEQKVSQQTVSKLMTFSSLSYYIIQATNIHMLCDIMEYENGGTRPSSCNGLLTNVDTLLSLPKPKCRIDHRFISVPTKKTDNAGEHAWLDVRRLFRGEEIPFQIPNSKWWIKHSKFSDELRNDTFYLSALEVYLPSYGKSGNEVRTFVMPTNIDNRLREDSKTYYVIPRSEQKRNLIQTAYMEGSRCRLVSFSNPYFNCGGNYRPLFTNLCPTTPIQENKDDLLHSIYSKFHIKVTGYKDVHLSEPVTDLDIQLGIRVCHFSAPQRTTHAARSKRATETIGKPICCPKDTQYYSESTHQCESCPIGSKGFLNNLICGQVIDIREPKDKGDLTSDKAARLCKMFGSTIASEKLLNEARALGQTSCKCGWIAGDKGYKIDSLTTRDKCVEKSPCKKSGFVHCKAIFYRK